MMHKILLILILNIVFLIPRSEVLAQAIPSGATACETINPLNGQPAIVGVYHCTPPKEMGKTSDDRCYCLDPAAKLPEIDCAKEPLKCTGGQGQRCTPGASTFTTTGPGIMTAIGCIPTEPQELVRGLLKYGTFAAGGIAFLIMILAAIQMITAEGNPESIKQGQERFYSAIIGLLLVIFSVLLMQVIGVDILGLPGFGRE